MAPEHTVLLGKTVRVQIPRPPNFVLLADKVGSKISIADITDEALRELGAAFTERLLARAEEIREWFPER